MCVFTHFAAGAVVSAYAPHIALMPVLALGSHAILDMIPHFDFENMILEIVLGLVALAILLAGGVYSLPIIAGGVIAALPDMENLLVKTGKITSGRKIFPTHSGMLPHGGRAGTVNLSLQVFFSVVVIGFLIWRAA
ncbi:MAG: hypothetical protein JW814_08350 [Candidatus Krumholzibacteriota bacterium]|nr:hypothetical protein [Candidatus Krumholzibacteriota bacterium]